MAWAVGRARAGSAVDLLIAALPGAPFTSVAAAAQLVRRSFQATNEAVRRLETAGVLRQVTVGRRNRAYEAKPIVDAFTALERQLASPIGEIRTSPPARSAGAGPACAMMSPHGSLVSAL